jgi:hypothetical protein
VPMRDERLQLIRNLEEARGGTRVICYLTSTRSNLESPMAMDVIPVIYEHLRWITTPKDETKIDLFIHSNGGDGIVPWRLVPLIREKCSRFSVLVPHKAFSAATLTALGADAVVMHPLGCLGADRPDRHERVQPTEPAEPEAAPRRERRGRLVLHGPRQGRRGHPARGGTRAGVRDPGAQGAPARARQREAGQTRMPHGAWVSSRCSSRAFR